MFINIPFISIFITINSESITILSLFCLFEFFLRKSLEFQGSVKIIVKVEIFFPSKGKTVIKIEPLP